MTTSYVYECIYQRLVEKCRTRNLQPDRDHFNAFLRQELDPQNLELLFPKHVSVQFELHPSDLLADDEEGLHSWRLNCNRQGRFKNESRSNSSSPGGYSDSMSDSSFDGHLSSPDLSRADHQMYEEETNRLTETVFTPLFEEFTRRHLLDERKTSNMLTMNDEKDFYFSSETIIPNARIRKRKRKKFETCSDHSNGKRRKKNNDLSPKSQKIKEGLTSSDSYSEEENLENHEPISSTYSLQKPRYCPESELVIPSAFPNLWLNDFYPNRVNVVDFPPKIQHQRQQMYKNCGGSHHSKYFHHHSRTTSFFQNEDLIPEVEFTQQKTNVKIHSKHNKFVVQKKKTGLRNIKIKQERKNSHNSILEEKKQLNYVSTHYVKENTTHQVSRIILVKKEENEKMKQKYKGKKKLESLSKPLTSTPFPSSQPLFSIIENQIPCDDYTETDDEENTKIILKIKFKRKKITEAITIKSEKCVHSNLPIVPKTKFSTIITPSSSTSFPSSSTSFPSSSTSFSSSSTSIVKHSSPLTQTNSSKPESLKIPSKSKQIKKKNTKKSKKITNRNKIVSKKKKSIKSTVIELPKPAKQPRISTRWTLKCAHCLHTYKARPTPKNSRYVVNHACVANCVGDERPKRRQYVIGTRTRRCKLEHGGPCMKRIAD